MGKEVVVLKKTRNWLYTYRFDYDLLLSIAGLPHILKSRPRTRLDLDTVSTSSSQGVGIHTRFSKGMHISWRSLSELDSKARSSAREERSGLRLDWTSALSGLALNAYRLG
ncbi:hypothetical protein VNO77_22757 [Canavalia gladiata]|uniref:Uncharacterized protein n=1 Tax=Canavalia gladiata TaxID=3824 RepID=A0AAN9L8F5_CANGL